MSKPISVGDLVVVVKPTPCCGNTNALGLHFVVKEIRPAIGRYHCEHCKTTWPNEVVALQEPPYAFRLWRLKRIPPLGEIDGLESEEVDKLPSPRMVEAAKRYKRLVTSK